MAIYMGGEEVGTWGVPGVRGGELTRRLVSPHLPRLECLSKFLSNAGFYAGVVLHLPFSFVVLKVRNDLLKLQVTCVSFTNEF